MRNFWGSALVTLICMIGAFIYGGPSAAFAVLILGVLEVSVSLDNAVANAKVLKDMSRFWQVAFLTVGIFIAVFVVRLILPVEIVALAANLSFMDTAHMLINDPVQYSHHLHEAHLSISAFGGMFLLMVFLDFVFNDEKEHFWLGAVEEKLASFGGVDGIKAFVALAVLMGIASVLEGVKSATFLYAGSLGLVIFFAMSLLKNLFEEKETGDAVVNTVKKGGLVSFLYLEVLDASFSLDGVIGAFAISKDPVVIGMGLTIGAMFVRSLTVYLVKKGTLDELVYLEAGAMCAIGVLALIMISSGFVDIPELFTALVGAVLIGLSVWSSLRHKKKEFALSAPAEA